MLEIEKPGLKSRNLKLLRFFRAHFPVMWLAEVPKEFK
jgi:hypothetical protein